MTLVCITFFLSFLFGSAESGIRGSQDEERFVIFSVKSDKKYEIYRLEYRNHVCRTSVIVCISQASTKGSLKFEKTS